MTSRRGRNDRAAKKKKTSTSFDWEEETPRRGVGRERTEEGKDKEGTEWKWDTTEKG